MKLISVCLLAVGAMPAAAQDWKSLIIGQSGNGAERAFADAFHAAAGLKGSKIDVIDVLRNVEASEVTVALGSLSGSDRVMVYYSGRVQGDALTLDGGVLDLSDMVASLGAAKLVMLIENCAASQPGAAQLPELSSLGNRVTIVASARPGANCPPQGRRITDMLQAAEKNGAETDLGAVLGGFVVAGALDQSIRLHDHATILTSVTSAPTLSVSTVTPAQSSGTVISAVNTVTSGAVVVPAGLSASPTSSGDSEVVIFNAPSGSQLAARPRSADLPEPSIIVGIIQGAETPEFEQTPDTPEVTDSEIAYDNVEARKALRASDPALFANLVERGVLDPPDALLARALQTELARMRCYTSGIDGDWGPGSKRSVTAYFDQIEGETAVSQEPTIELFRQIILRDDVTCPVQQQVTRTRSNTSSSSSGGGGGRRPAANPTPAPTRTPAPTSTPQVRVRTR